MKVAGVILAGGRSSRMGGGDKFLLELGDRRLIDHVIDRLKPQVDAIVLAANGDPARFSDLGFDVVQDSIEGFAGPLAGILAGMDWAVKNDFEYIFTVAADTPFFPENLLIALQMAMESERTPIAMTMTPDPDKGLGFHPTFALWSVSLRDNLREALKSGVRKVIRWSEQQGSAHLVYNFDGTDPFFNVNTPEDLATAKELLKEFTR